MKKIIVPLIVGYVSFLIGRGFELALVKEGWY